MNPSIALLGLIQIISAITLGIFILALTYKIVQWVGRKYYKIEDYNMAYSIFVSAIIISVGIMLSGILQPMLSSYRILSQQNDSFQLALDYFMMGGMYIAIAYSATVLIGLISTFLYSKLTPISEFEEIRENNIGVALIISSILVTLTLLTKPGVIMLIEAIVPYPEMPPI